jgi:hypothetical protein
MALGATIQRFGHSKRVVLAGAREQVLEGKVVRPYTQGPTGAKLGEMEILGLVRNLGIARNLFRVMACLPHALTTTHKGTV